MPHSAKQLQRAYKLLGWRHTFYTWLALIGMRDRLRCPRCKSVGTWKPRGSKYSNDVHQVRRWLCKWCGLYIDMGGIKQCQPAEDVWIGREEGREVYKTPIEQMNTLDDPITAEGRYMYNGIDPWNG